MFGKKKKTKTDKDLPVIQNIEKTDSENTKFSKPEICSLNLKKSNSSIIDEAGFYIYPGSLGSIVRVANEYNTGHYCLLNSNIPKNLHEFDILIFDLHSVDEVDYSIDDHKKNQVSSSDDQYFYCAYPKTIFDPRAYSGSIISSKVTELKDRDSIVIIFANTKESTEYQIAKKDGRYAIIVKTIKKDNYSFMSNRVRFQKNKNGKNVIPNKKIKKFESILNKYCEEMEYNVIFYHPTRWIDGTQKELESFIPLLYNNSDEIIGYAELDDKQWIFVFPELKGKGLFIKELIEEILPGIIPQLFPDHQKGLWLEKAEYFLPNESNLISEKKTLIERHNKEIIEIDDRIKKNKEKFSFLHKILLATGDELVTNVIIFLKWLGFKNIKNMDEENPDKKEEDITVEDNDGLLIIEAKGIGGTSKDDECAQISKIRSRRCEERGNFDVFGLYIVNHQRHIPPSNRKNPPFSEDQIKDAEINKRGLVTTWTLFNLFFNIEIGAISKKKAMSDLKNIGLISFEPDKIEDLGIVSEIFQKGEIILIENLQKRIDSNSCLFVFQNERYKQLRILSLQQNSKDVDFVSSGEVGIKINIRLKKGDLIKVLK